MQLSVWEIASRLFLALVSAAVIGWEREAKGRPAGLRTHMLVALGSCLFTLLAFDIYSEQVQVGVAPSMDPLKVIAGIVGGIGFLGAGAIIQSRGQIHGLTTAAGIWVVAAVGVAAAVGKYGTVVIVVVLAFVTLWLLGKLEIRDVRSAVRGDDSSDD